jgi:hypothetical protein
MAALRRQQCGEIDRRIGRSRRSFGRRHVGNNLIERRIAMARRHEDADNRKIFFCNMDEMRLHREAFASEQMLTRMLEMELNQPITAAAQRLDCVSDVQRRLLAAGRAHPAGRIARAPAVGTTRPLVALV